MTLPNHFVKGIVFDPREEAVLLEPATRTDKFRLPLVKVRIGENPKSELKQEIQADFRIKLKFWQILPRGDGELLQQMHTHKFLLTYIFELTESELVINPKLPVKPHIWIYQREGQLVTHVKKEWLQVELLEADYKRISAWFDYWKLMQ